MDKTQLNLWITLLNNLDVLLSKEEQDEIEGLINFLSEMAEYREQTA